MEGLIHGVEETARKAIRLRAVEAVLLGERQSAVARRHGVTRQSLHTWLRRHRLSGAEGLDARRCGRTERRVLGPGAEVEVIESILTRAPWRLGLPGSCWTRNTVAALVEARHGVRLSHWQVDRMLRRWGFRSHKEVRRAYLRRPATAVSLLAAARGAAIHHSKGGSV